MVSRVTCEKVLKAFSLEPRVMSTQKPVIATRQEKLFTLVKAAWRYDIPFPRSRGITNTQTDTHTQNTAINIIDTR